MTLEVNEGILTNSKNQKLNGMNNNNNYYYITEYLYDIRVML